MRLQNYKNLNIYKRKTKYNFHFSVKSGKD